MTQLHYGRPPTCPQVLEAVRRSHQLGFRTIVLDEYQELQAQGVYPEDYDLFMPTVDLNPLFPPVAQEVSNGA